MSTWSSVFGSNPVTPSWLTKFVPGQTAWEPMQVLPSKIPSGQLWNKTPTSQREGLGSYINWVAGRVPGAIASYEDMIDIMLGMLPKRSPSRAGRWTTYRQ